MACQPRDPILALMLAFVRPRSRRLIHLLLGLSILPRFALVIFGAELPNRQLLGPVEELRVLDDFTPESRSAWETSAGSNIQPKFDTGINIPGIASSLGRLTLTHKDEQDRVSGHNWFSFKRSVPPGTLSSDATGIRLVMGSEPAAQWWLNIAVHVGKETYTHVIEPIYPNRTLIEHVIPFEEFKSGEKVLSSTNALAIDEIKLDTSSPTATLYLDRITTYRQQRYSSWLTFSSSEPHHNIFQPGERVLVKLTRGGELPPGAKAFRYEVQDYFENVTAKGTVPVESEPAHTLDLTPAAPGYYELRAFWVDAKGKDLENRSCILAEGSLPAGLVTFAVMPRTIDQNIELFKKMGTNAFFGLHGDFHGLGDRIGLCWRFDYSLWNYLEPEKPDRSSGMAPWVAQKIKNEPPQPDYRFHILPFAGNFPPPGWAKARAEKTPPFFDWQDYLPLVRDEVEVEKHLFPHQHPRIYGVAWEVNLNMPPDNVGIPYKPADVVELHRHVRPVIKQADPNSLVIGPCPSNLNPQWMDTIFAAGLLDYVDAIESHGYADKGFAPEENDYPAKLAAIRASMRRHHHGQELPVYITEAGIRGMLGSKTIYRKQAQFMTRLALILKGEGVRVFLPFYGIDYDRDGWWGFCFNLEVDAKSPWSTQRISPKPTVNAMAVCVGILEGARPVRRVESLGKDVWAYLFDKQGTPLLAVWSAGDTQEISLRLENPSSVELVDIMGHSASRPVQNGMLKLKLDGSPQYLIGARLAATPAN